MTCHEDQQSAGVNAATHSLDVTRDERTLLAQAPNVARDGELMRAEAESRDTSEAMLTSWQISQTLRYDSLLADEEIIEKAAVQKAIKKNAVQKE